jgi:hypothetical protein
VRAKFLAEPRQAVLPAKIGGRKLKKAMFRP